MSTRCIVPRTAGEASLGTLEKPWGAIYTNKIYNVGRFVASAPTYYQHEKNITATDKTKITIYPTWVNIYDAGYVLPASKVIDINTIGVWDDSKYATASNRAGQDFYIYACVPVNDSSTPDIIISKNASIPTGQTSNTSRKIGGFHCECSAIGTTASHSLSNYATGDIIPFSVWDLLKRPVTCTPEGMVYIPTINKWCDIYLPSWDGSKLVSVFNGTIVNGTSTTKIALHGEAFVEYFAKVGKKLLTRDEFKVVAMGSNQGTNINTSNNPNTTGGHQDTLGHRMVSNYGLEDCCGVAWQWTADIFETLSKSSTRTFSANAVYNASIDGSTSASMGSANGELCRALVGGAWNTSTNSGSRAVMTDQFGSVANAMFTARGCADNII